MSTVDSKGRVPQDLVAVFHASFHPTRGNIIDWSTKASDDLSLDNLEFSALPSGLHLVEQDVVYFNKDGRHGVCIFRRRKTTEQGHRGFRLSSLGILLASSKRPRPWIHVPALKQLFSTIYTRTESSGEPQLSEEDWAPARVFFEERKVMRADLGGAGDWNGWDEELDPVDGVPAEIHPAFHLPHLLRILGPSSLTLYKHVLGRRRILIFTLPPVQAACILCHIAASICYEHQVESGASTPGSTPIPGLRGKSREPLNVLGMVSLTDLDRMSVESSDGRGWVACTTDAIFLEKPAYYDLLIDLTTSSPNKASRPTFYTTKPIPPQPGSSRGPTYKLTLHRFAWSDIKLWNEIERICQNDSEHAHSQNCCSPSEQTTKSSKLMSTWSDVWRVYEDVCIICAGLWIGSWRGNSVMSYSTSNGAENWGGVRLEGDDDLSLGAATHVRNLGLGIEGGPSVSGSGRSSLAPTTKPMRRSSGMSWTSGRGVGTTSSTAIGSKGRQASSSTVYPAESAEADDDAEERRARKVVTVLSLLQTFQTYTAFQLSVLESLLRREGSWPPSASFSGSGKTLSLTPKDILAFELGPLSGSDTKYLEWLTSEYAAGTTVVIKRGWRDLFGMIFGYY